MCNGSRVHSQTGSRFGVWGWGLVSLREEGMLIVEHLKVNKDLLKVNCKKSNRYIVITFVVSTTEIYFKDIVY